MGAIDVKDKKYLIRKVDIQGKPGPPGAIGGTGPPGGVTLPIDSSDVNHDGSERSGELVNDLLDELLYEAILITSFTNQHGTQEKGVTLANVGLDWSRNKTSIIQSITGSGIGTVDPGNTATTYTILGINLSVNGSWTLNSGDGTNNAVATTTINFYNKIHWGARVTGTINDAFILGLGGNRLQSTFATTFTVTAGASDYIYFALPTAYGNPAFIVGGFAGGFTKVSSAITHTNASGHIENYDIWRSNTLNLGETTVTVQ